MLKPLGNRVVIKPILKEDKENFGIVIPDTVVDQKRMTKGEVISIGKTVKSVKVGDIVAFSPFHFDEIGAEMIVEERDIWAVIE